MIYIPRYQFQCILNNVSEIFVHSNLAINSIFTCPDINSSASEHFRTHWVICTLESCDILSMKMLIKE